MRKRRKITSPREYMQKKDWGSNLTRPRVGRLHTEMQANGYVSSSPVNAPKEHPRVWVSRHDPWAKPVTMAHEERVLSGDEFLSLCGGSNGNAISLRQFTTLGIAIVPCGNDMFQLVGTSPEIARFVNRAHHGKKRRTITDKEIIRLYKNRPRGSRSRKPGDGKLQECLIWFSNRFKLDLSDLISHGSMLL